MRGFSRKPAAASKDVARDRLKMVLVTDRVDTSSHIIEMLKRDVLQAIRNYLDINESEFEIQICQQVRDEGDESGPRLKADIPIKNMRKRV